MAESRALIDVSGLPHHAFGSRTPAWWGTVGFMVIEGTSLVLLLASLLYVRRNFDVYPPAGTAAPDLLAPTIGTALFLLSIIPARVASRAARLHDLGTMQRILPVLLLIQLAIGVVRVFEFDALNTRFDSNAYGSILWFTLGLHSLLLLADFAESFFIALIFFRGPLEKKHFSEATDDIIYWYFLIGSWIPCYVLLYLGPHFL